MNRIVLKDVDKKSTGKIVSSIIGLAQENVNVFLLQANTGVGKTFLVSCFVNRFLGELATSPSFSFINEYHNEKGSVFHYDLYLKDTEESKMIMLNSLLNHGIHFIEWGDEELFETLKSMGFCAAIIKIAQNNKNRDYEIVH